MGFLDKVKNLFTEPDDSDDEIEIEQIEKKIPKKVSETKKNVEKKREKQFEIDETKELEPFYEEEKKSKVERQNDYYKEKTQEYKRESKDDYQEENEFETKFDEFKEDVVVKEEPERPTREKVKTPIFFTENDFADLEPEKPKTVEKKKDIPQRITSKKEDKKNLYSGSYTSTSILTTEKTTFKPTPVISPIYGILDKNYSKEDIVEKREEREETKVVKRNADKFDQVRQKAYGKLENDLTSTIYSEPKKKKEKIEEEIDLFDELEKDELIKNSNKVKEHSKLASAVSEQEKNIKDLEEVTMDLTKELDNLLLQRDTYNQKKEKIERESNNKNNDELLTENELFNIIDSIYEEGKE